MVSPPICFSLRHDTAHQGTDKPLRRRLPVRLEEFSSDFGDVLPQPKPLRHQLVKGIGYGARLQHTDIAKALLAFTEILHVDAFLREKGT
jgi:hypothetical protein